MANSKTDDFFSGFQSFWRASGFMFKHKMGIWYLAPAAIWLIIFISSVASVSSLLTPIIKGWVEPLLPKQVNDPHGTWDMVKNIFTIGLKYLTTVVIYLFITLITWRFTKYIVLIVCSPILAYLSELAEEKITGKTYPFNFSQFLKDVLRGILITLRNLFLEILLIIAGGIISFFVPVLSPVVAILLYIVNCYFMGFSMYDYVAERRRMGLSQSVGFMRKNTWRLIGLGFGFNLVSMVPILSWILAPINGAVGAVISLEKPDNGNISGNQPNLLDY